MRGRCAMKTGQPAAFEMLLDHDFGWDERLICGGSVEGASYCRTLEKLENCGANSRHQTARFDGE